MTNTGGNLFLSFSVFITMSHLMCLILLLDLLCV